MARQVLRVRHADVDRAAAGERELRAREAHRAVAAALEQQLDADALLAGAANEWAGDHARDLGLLHRRREAPARALDRVRRPNHHAPGEPGEHRDDDDAHGQATDGGGVAYSRVILVAMEDRLAELRSRIALLAVIDRSHQVFGADAHRYELAEPLTRDELAGLERALGVALPEDVRAFLLHVGASGAGPYYGLMRLGQSPPHSAADEESLDADLDDDYADDDDAPQHVWDAADLDEDEHDEEEDDGGDDEDEDEPDDEAGRMSLAGTLALADQGCGMTSLLYVQGPHRGEVWADTSGRGHLVAESPSFLAWYEGWLERALVEWAERAAPRIALEGPDAAEELEALSIVFDLLSRRARPSADDLSTLGYLHLRERRYGDADAAFVAASTGPSTSDLSEAERAARLHRDRARLEYVRGNHLRAVDLANTGLHLGHIWYSTTEELRGVLEDALHAAGRVDDALAILDQRASESYFDFGLHHRLANERLARGDVTGASAALERAAHMTNIAGPGATFEDRVARSFGPIIESLRAGGRLRDADALQNRVELLLHAN